MDMYKVTGTNKKGYITFIVYVRAKNESEAVENAKMHDINSKETIHVRAENTKQ